MTTGPAGLYDPAWLNYSMNSGQQEQKKAAAPAQLRASLWKWTVLAGSGEEVEKEEVWDWTNYTESFLKLLRLQPELLELLCAAIKKPVVTDELFWQHWTFKTTRV